MMENKQFVNKHNEIEIFLNFYNKNKDFLLNVSPLSLGSFENPMNCFVYLKSCQNKTSKELLDFPVFSLQPKSKVKLT